MIPEKVFAKFIKNIEQLQPFESKPKIAIALSGGIDSMALLLLCKQWIENIDGELIALTVDHALRAESSLEAMEVGLICAKLNVKHAILRWKHLGINTNIQAKARQARYELLTQHCQDHDTLHLFTGHQMQDTVENFFIKLSRGSGIFGLATSNSNFIKNIRICKPILNFTKNECIKLLQTCQVKHVEDPSNLKRIYFRNDIRFNLQNFCASGAISLELFEQRVWTSAKHLEASAKSVQENIIDAMCKAVSIHQAGFAIVYLQVLQTYCLDTQNYLLTYLLTIIGGNSKAPRSTQVAGLLNLLQSNNFKGATLSKCALHLLKNDLIIYKELCSIIDYDIPINKNACFWDNRFRIYTNNKQLCVTKLDAKSYDHIKEKIDLNQICDAHSHRYKILFTLPAIKVLEKIVAVPNINYYEDFSDKDFICIFEPSYVSKIMHFVK